MHQKSKYYYILICSIVSFSLGLVGSGINDYFHNEDILENASHINYFIIPIILGIGTGIYTVFYWKRKYRQQKIFKQLKESEYNHRILFENMLDIVCILDNNGNLVNVNKAGLKLYEYSREELLNMNVSELIYEDDVNNSNEHFNKLETDGFYNMYEGRVKTKSGKIIWIQVNSTEYFKDGIKVGSQDIIRDITLKKENEQKIMLQNEKLKKLNDTKDKFFSIIAHDLKSPFNSILGFSELLNSEYDQYNDIQKKKYFQIIHNGINSTYKLLENLLIWSQTQRGNIVFNLEKVNLYLIANEAIKLTSLFAENKSILVTNLISESIIIKADKEMLSTIIRNLLSNAVKFTPKGGNIELSSRCISINEQNFTEISIKDNGVGISKELQSQIFEINNKNVTPGTENEKGTGLGLILCKEFVEKHDGKIWVESDEGIGSVFIFTLPLIN